MTVWIACLGVVASVLFLLDMYRCRHLPPLPWRLATSRRWRALAGAYLAVGIAIAVVADQGQVAAWAGALGFGVLAVNAAWQSRREHQRYVRELRVAKRLGVR